MKPKSADLQNAPNCGKRTERIRIQFESAAGLVVTLLNADWLSSRQKLVAGFLSRKIRPIRVSTFTLYGILSPRRVWCERTMRVFLGGAMFAAF